MARVEGFDMLRGDVELDEASVGGQCGSGAAGKTIVMGMVERDGRTRTQIVPNVKKATLRNVMLQHVEPGSTMSTDELMSCGLLVDDGYVRGAVKHGEKEWAYYNYRRDATHSTNHADAFW